MRAPRSEENTMNADVHRDPFAAPRDVSPPQQDFEVAWFDAPRRSSRAPFSCSASQPPAPHPIDDPVADPWFK